MDGIVSVSAALFLKCGLRMRSDMRGDVDARLLFVVFSVPASGL